MILNRTWSWGWIVAQIIVATAMLCSPSLMVGRPFAFSDTVDYLRWGEAAWRETGLFQTPVEPGAAPVSSSSASGGVPAQAWEDDARMGILARSMFYAAPMAAAVGMGGLWAAAIAQALAVASVLRRLVSLVAPRREGLAYLAIMAALTAFTPLPFTASLLMPDFLTSLMMIGACVLLFYADRMEWLERVGWWLLILWALLSHGSHPPIFVLMLAGASAIVLWLRSTRKVSVMRLAVLGGALAVGVLLNAAYVRVLEHKLGGPPLNPPFLMARLLADGPGREYLRSVCRAEDLKICAFQNHPLRDSNRILWSPDPKLGVFQVSPWRDRSRLIAEEREFVVGVLRHDPVGVAVAAVSNGWRQLGAFGLEDAYEKPVKRWVSAPYWSTTEVARLLPNLDKCRRDMRACEHPAAWRSLEMVHRTAVALALAAIAMAVWRNRARINTRLKTAESRLMSATTVLGWGLLVNGLVCGILSGPFDRYQSRVIWLVVLVATLWWVPKRRALDAELA